MFERVIVLLAFLNRKVCDADRLSHTCEKAIELANKDDDGKITVCEFITIMVKLLKKE